MSSTGPDAPADQAPVRPFLQVVSPHATPEEVAALVAVLAAVGGGEGAAAPARTPEWQSLRRRLRTVHPHGPGGWRASGMPR